MAPKKKTPSKRLQPLANQQKAASLIVSGLPPGEVAHRVGVADRTLRTWYAKEDFQMMLTAARSEVGSRTFDAVGALAQESIAGLRSAIAVAIAHIHSEGFDPIAAAFLLRVSEVALLNRMPAAAEQSDLAPKIIIQIPDNGRHPARAIDATPR